MPESILRKPTKTSRDLDSDTFPCPETSLWAAPGDPPRSFLCRLERTIVSCSFSQCTGPLKRPGLHCSVFLRPSFWRISKKPSPLLTFSSPLHSHPIFLYSTALPYLSSSLSLSPPPPPPSWSVTSSGRIYIQYRENAYLCPRSSCLFWRSPDGSVTL